MIKNNRVKFEKKTQAVRHWEKDRRAYSHIEMPGDGFAYLVPIFKKKPKAKKDGG